MSIHRVLEQQKPLTSEGEVKNHTWIIIDSCGRFCRRNLMQLAHLGLTFQVFFFGEEVAAVSIITTDGPPFWLSGSSAPRLSVCHLG
jgi:hypothetical protein